VIVIRRGWSALLEAEPLLLLARCSLLVVLINSHLDPPVFVLMAVACVVALPNPRIVLSPWFWAGLFVGIGTRQLSDWHTIDDHIVATTYWCGALALGLAAQDRRGTLAASARLLIGMVFAFATAWKLGSGEFIDGRFFRYTLLFDDRFRSIAHVIGGTPGVMDMANHDGLHALGRADTTGATMLLREGSRNVGVAWTMTIWGVLVEAAVAVSFLVPLRRHWAWLRHAALYAFAVTAYVIVPVGGFGVLLLVLGSATADTPPGRAGYVVGAAGLVAWAGIWPVVFL
jgi:hypothetical protein